MARDFAAASSQYLEVNVAVVTAVPFSMGCWFRSTATLTDQVLMGLCDKDVGNQWHMLALSGVADTVAADTRQVSEVAAQTTTSYSVNTWHHTLGVWAAANDRRAYIDGGSKGTEATSLTPTGLDRLSIGRIGDSTPGLYMAGRIAEAAIWDVALSDAEALILARGFSPLFVRPASLVAYYRLIRGGTEIDLIGANNVVESASAPTVAEHPRIIYPAAPLIVTAPAAPAGAKLYYSGGFAAAQRLTRGIGWVQRAPVILPAERAEKE